MSLPASTALLQRPFAVTAGEGVEDDSSSHDLLVIVWHATFVLAAVELCMVHARHCSGMPQ